MSVQAYWAPIHGGVGGGDPRGSAAVHRQTVSPAPAMPSSLATAASAGVCGVVGVGPPGVIGNVGATFRPISPADGPSPPPPPPGAIPSSATIYRATPAKLPRPAPQCSRSPTSVLSLGGATAHQAHQVHRAYHALPGAHAPNQGRVPGPAQAGARPASAPAAAVVACPPPAAGPRAAAVGPAPAPAENRKYKTEMCKNVLETGYCRFGSNCHYAHSESERHVPSAGELTKDDRLLLPCSILVATGYCPYDHRCKSLHDPRAANAPTLEDAQSAGVAVLEHCTKAKRSGDAIPDRLYHRNLNGVRQRDPLVAPYLWEARRRCASSAPTSSGGKKSEFRDAYDLVCNVSPGGTSVAAPSSSLQRRGARRTGGGAMYSDVVGGGARSGGATTALGELQRICIALKMREGKLGNGHLDFVYAPKDCLNGQPCMVLQVRHFRLLDVTRLLRSRPRVSAAGDVVSEVSAEAYRAGKRGLNAPSFVSVHEVAFDSKGKRSCNLGLWFDASVGPCSSSKAKKMSKKEEPWRVDAEEDDGRSPLSYARTLFCLPNNDEFVRSFPRTADRAPFVFMQPVDDSAAGRELAREILAHRADALLRERYGSRVPDLECRLDRIRKEHHRMTEDLERWSWPKTSDASHFVKTKEEQNRTAYVPPTSFDEDGGGGGDSLAAALWRSFVANLQGDDVTLPVKARLPALRAISEKVEAHPYKEPLPRLGRPAGLPAPQASEVLPRASSSLSEATWRELLLGSGDGSWRRTMEAHAEQRRRNASRSGSVTPSSMSGMRSPVPVAQRVYAR